METLLGIASRIWLKASGLALLAAAAGLLAIPALLAMDTSWIMHTEGSPGGTIGFVFFAGIGVVAAIAGLACAAAGIGLLAAGSESRGIAVLAALVCVPLVAAGLARGFLERSAADARDPVKSRQARERTEAYWAARWEGIEPSESGMYRLVWKARKRLPPAELTLPIEDLRPDLEAELPEPGAGPVRFALPAVQASGATLTLYFSDEHENVQRPGGPRYRPDPEIAPLWVSRKDGEWRYLGVDCDRARMLGMQSSTLRCYTPDSRLLRIVPLRGVHRATLRGDSYGPNCRTMFPFHARPAVVESPGSCMDDTSVAALAAAMGLLERLGADTAAPPSPAERLARVRAAAANCENAAKGLPATGGDSAARRMRGVACGYAIQLAAREIAEQPDDVAPLLVRSLEAGPPAGRQPRAGYVDAALRGLEAAARKDGRSVVLAYVLRIEALGSGAGAARPSVEALLARADELPGPADPLFERVYDAMRSAPLPAAQASQRLAVLSSLHEKAAAVDARSELAWKTRYGVCRERAAMGVERETLKACADDLVAEWQGRVARTASFAPFDGEPALALAITRMYAQSADATSASAGVAQGLRRTRELAAARIAPHRTEVFDELDRREAQLAAKPKVRASR